MTPALSRFDFLTSHGGEFGLDPPKFAATGDSAGGHLAAMLGLTRGEGVQADGDGRVRAEIDLFGPTVWSASESWATDGRP